jgi:hypothetical protein
VRKFGLDSITLKTRSACNHDAGNSKEQFRTFLACVGFCAAGDANDDRAVDIELAFLGIGLGGVSLRMI